MKLLSSVDARWQRLTKARRADVYRAVGRAIRDARTERQTELAADLRLVIEVLRKHARKPRGS
jgi:hypothetical protein